jgi:gamma-glutamyltranspeptidase/glutathione hydrolase
VWIEAAKLAFADREACYGDPRVAAVPLAHLLSPAYNEDRRRLVDPEKASLELRPGAGRLPEGWPLVDPVGDAATVEPRAAPVEPQALGAAIGRSDTTQCVAVDRWGNCVSATPSGGWIPTSPVVAGLGFPVGTRAQMFVLDPDHPNALAPGKRPRTTLSPSLARLADGRVLAFGTPGGDQQDQWTLHFFLDCVDFGVGDLQEAIDAPTLHALHAPSSFYPRRAQPGVVEAEERIPEEVLGALELRGHRVRRVAPWSHGRVMAASFDPATGLCEAAASPRFQVAYAIALP